MKINTPLSFIELEEIRKKIGAPKSNYSFAQPLSELEKIKLKKNTKSKLEKGFEDVLNENDKMAEVFKEDGYTYVLYIKNWRLKNSLPKFHLTWCEKIDEMYEISQLKRYESIRPETTKFDVVIDGKELKNINLKPCRFCSSELNINIRDFNMKEHYEKYDDKKNL